MNYSLYFLGALLIRIVIFGATVGDSIAAIAFASLYGFSLFLDSKKEVPINESLKKDLEELRSTVNSLRIAKGMGRL